MSQLIYLSRHGTTVGNKRQLAKEGDPWHTDPRSYDELTEEGVREAGILGTYLNKLAIKNPVFVDSNLARTWVTSNLVATSMNIVLIPEINYHSSPALEEEVPWECLTSEQREEYCCGCNHGKPVQAALLLGREVHTELCRIGDIYPGRDLIAILHGGINAALISYIDRGSLEVMDNCGLYVLERDKDTLKIREEYLSYAELEKRIGEV